MFSATEDRRGLLHQQSADLSDALTAALSAPTAVPHQRHGFRRKPTNDEPVPTTLELGQESISVGSSDQSQRRDQGLGITEATRPISITRKPVGATGSPRGPSGVKSFQSTSDSSPGQWSSPISPDIATPGSAKPFLSSPWHTHNSVEHMYGDAREGDLSVPHNESTRSGDTRAVSFPDEQAEHYILEDDTTRLKHASVLASHQEPSGVECTTKRDIQSGRGSWLSITLLMLSFYSTFMSILWLVTASVQPRWGRSIDSGGTLSPSTASLLTALFAKTIELSFVTVFVGFLGQALSRRSIAKYSNGITIAELSMRTWVIQPGFMLTHWQTIRYVGWTFLSILSFTAALGAILYTTASDALVAPKLKFGGWTNIQMQGLVRTSYANPGFINENCQTPITTAEDPDAGSTCTAIEDSGQSYHNFLSWMQLWALINQNGTGESQNIFERPQAVAMLYDNTTVQGSWVMANSSNATANFERFSRIINNVTMAMPHAGVYAAARETVNNIMQPDELGGVGGYSIRASVVSPAINVLCVNMAQKEIAPLVYTEWPNANVTNSTQVSTQIIPANPDTWVDDIPLAGSNQKWLNSTAVDDVFQWGEKYGRRPPVFELFPSNFNTILNKTVYEADSVYIMAKSINTANYTVCSLRSFLYPNCSTQHDVSGTNGGSSLVSHCEDPDDQEAYALSVPISPISLSKDWANYALSWALSISLNDGSVNGDSSTARILSQLVLTDSKLPALQPSLAEALAVLAGSTLLISTTQAAFVHYWQYDSSILDPGDYQIFNASVSTQQYTSGYAQTWQAAFYPILLIVAIINIFCFVYFFMHSGLLTDFTEPQNLFALAVNSPPSESLAGSCGAGPERNQFKIDWFVRHDSATNHYYIQEGEAWKRKMMAKTSGYELSPSFSSPNSANHARASSYSKLSYSKNVL